MLGLVQTQRVVLYAEDDPLTLESGATLAPVEVAYETYGELAPDGRNAVFVCHALTGDAHAAGHHGDPARRGWWDNLIGPGRPLDTDRFHVICPNLLGGCQGTTGPSSTDARTGRAYGLRFPLFSVRDLTTVHRRLLAHLGIQRLHAVIGGSLGGMQALQWMLDAPEQAGAAVAICASARLSAQNIALSAVARAAITEDPDFLGGDYAAAGRRPQRGLSLARRLGHITYLSEESMRRKFDRERIRPEAPMTLEDDFQVERYLRHQGESFLRRFDPLSYLYLSRVMDYFDPFADPGPDLHRVAAAGARLLALSFDSDWRFGSEHSRAMVEPLQRAGVDARHVELPSPWGHDSFLLDLPDYHREVAGFVGQQPPAIAGRITSVSEEPTAVSRPSSTRTSSSLR